MTRPAISKDLADQVLVEAGHRCAIPTCRQHPVQVHHIVAWAECQEHEFGNLIALCNNCHERAGENYSEPRRISPSACRLYKAKLQLVNSRYGDLELRLLEVFAKSPQADVLECELNRVGTPPSFFELQVMRLVDDGFLSLHLGDRIMQVGPFAQYLMQVRLTESGREFVNHWSDPDSALDSH